MSIRKIAIWLAVGVVAAITPLLTDAYSQYVVNLMLAYMVVAVGLNIVLGFAGQLSFGHSAFVGIGAYATAVIMEHASIPFLPALLLAGLMTGVVGLVVGLPAVRIRGLYLALVTIAFLYLVIWVLVHWEPVTNGTSGLAVPGISVLGIDVSTDRDKYFLILPITLAMTWLAVRLMRSKVGRAFVMVREAELAAQCSGINIMMTKALAFALSAFFAGIGGGLFAVAVGFLVPSSFGLLQMVTQFAMVLIGGLSSILGAVVGAALLTVLPEFLRQFQGAEEIFYGIVMMVFIIFMPDGIVGMCQRRGWLRRPLLLHAKERAAHAPGAAGETGASRYDLSPVEKLHRG